MDQPTTPGTSSARPAGRVVARRPPSPRESSRSRPPTRPTGQFDAHPECVKAAEQAAALLEELGHSVENSYPRDLDDPDYIPNFLARWTCGVDWNIKYWSAAIGREIGPEDVEPCTWALAEAGRGHSGGDLLRAVEHAQAGARRVASWWADDGYDLLLTPTCGEPPPRLGEPD